VGEVVELDGFYYCSCCGERNLDVVNTGAKEGEGIGVGGIYLAKHKRQYVSSPSSTPEDFGSKGVNFDDYIKQIRLRYVMGLQIMIELQCEALVKEFKVTLLICGLVGPIRLRLISKAGVFDDDWADKEFYDSHLQKEGNNMKFSFLVYISKFTCTLQLEYPYLYGEINFTIWLLIC
jgi:hypothetical protein